jgi:hypothetical protein
MGEHWNEIRSPYAGYYLVAYSKDITGFKFGRLLALRLYGKAGRENVWVCACECGKVVNVRLGNLTSGNTKSCGCGKVGVRGG